MSHTTAGKAVCGIAAALSLLLLACPGRPATKEVSVLHFGTTETFVEENVPEGSDEAAAEAAYRHFIRAVTGLDSDVVALENHEVLAERLAGGRLHLGVFMGYEFAWAQARHPRLKVLAAGVNDLPYLSPALVVHRDGPVGKIADLEGKALALPRWGQGYGRLFLAAQSRLAGRDPGAFLGRIDSFEDAETPLDDVVDKTRQAAVVDRLSLEAYRRRKPARAARLKTLCESSPMPPPVIAYYEGNLDPRTVTRLRDDLTRFHERARGEQLLMLFRLTHFAPPSRDFECVLAGTRKTYPAPALRRRTEADSGKGPRLPAGPRAGPRQGGPEYYVCVFACDRAPPACAVRTHVRDVRQIDRGLGRSAHH